MDMYTATCRDYDPIIREYEYLKRRGKGLRFGAGCGMLALMLPINGKRFAPPVIGGQLLDPESRLISTTAWERKRSQAIGD